MADLEAPPDVPEGTAQIVLSVTAFQNLLVWLPGLRVTDWGEPAPFSGMVYTPSVVDDYAYGADQTDG